MRARFLAMITCAVMLGVLGAEGASAPAAGPQRIVFESGDTIHEVDLSGLHRRILIPGHFQADAIKGLAALPDGSLVLGVNDHLVRYDARGKRVADLGAGQLPTASPDGSQLAFGVYDARLGQARIWLMHADGSGRRQLTSGALDGAPAWSPDGKTILFTRSVRNALTAGVPSTWLETIPVGGGTPKRLTASGLDAGGRYSPDGRWIAFASERDKVFEDCGSQKCYQPQLYVMHADGTGAHRITRDHVFGLPVFASASTIVYSREGVNDTELFRIGIDGSCRARLTRDVLFDLAPTVPPGAVPDAQGCLPATPVQDLPSGPNFDPQSTLSLAAARSRRGLALYWLGPALGENVLTRMGIAKDVSDPSRLSSTVNIEYDCLSVRDDCSTRVFLSEYPLCSLPVLSPLANEADPKIDTLRGVPRIRYPERDQLLVGRTVISIGGNHIDRERVERALRSLNAPDGRTRQGQNLPAPPKGVLKGAVC